MARITVEDCIKTISNRFDLVVVASKRSRQLASGSPMTIDRDNDKNPVVALREISENIVNYCQYNKKSNRAVCFKVIKTRLQLL